MIDLNETIIEKKNFFNRLVFVYLFFGMLFLFFLYRTFSLQVSSFTDYEIASLENKTREILIQPRRGIIYDRNGKIIVNNRPSYNLILKPSQIDNIDEHIEMIGNYIELSEEDTLFTKENFKRKAKLKDTGKILPGHGGLLDRIDGIIFVMPLVNLGILIL